MQEERPVTAKETLKISLNQVEMMAYPNRNEDYNIDAGNSPEDEFERKSRLLEERIKILEGTKVQTWKVLFPVFNIIAVLSLSGMQLGYGICQITTIYDQRQLLSTYQFSPPIGLAIGSMVSFMPFGAIFGSIFGRCIRKRTSLKIAHHIINVLCMISSFGLMQINLTSAILLGRFVQGFCIACYCSWSPKYIQDLAPISLKPFTRSIYSLWVVGSMMLGYFFGLVFYQNQIDNYYRIMFSFPGILAFIQLLMMLIFVPDSPSELFDRQLADQGRKVLAKIYSAEFIDMMVDKYKLQAEVKALRMTIAVQVEVYPDGRFRARFMGLFLNLFREFTGINSILVYAGLVIGPINDTLGPYANFALTLIAFMATVASHLFVVDRFGRRNIMIISAVVFFVCNIVIMTGMLVSSSTMVFVGMMIEILFFGLTYSTVSSIYPAEILKHEAVSYTTLTSWPAMLLVTLLPPVVGDVILPTHTPWPVFLFYAVYSLFSIPYLWFCAVESKDRQYYDIIKQF